MSTTTRRPGRLALRDGTLTTWAITYGVLCAFTLGSIFFFTVPPNGALARWWMDGRLNLQPHSVPSLGAALDTLAHNLLTAGWPLLFVALGLHRDGWTRDLGTILLSVWLGVNAALVGAAISVGDAAIWPYLPHVPVEWAAVALSATAWIVATERDVRPRLLASLTAGFVVLLATAAVLETYAVPHL